MVIESDLPQTDFDNLEVSIVCRLLVEILHKLKLMTDDIYYEKNPGNAEALDRDYKIYCDLKKL